MRRDSDNLERSGDASIHYVVVEDAARQRRNGDLVRARCGSEQLMGIPERCGFVDSSRCHTARFLTRRAMKVGCRSVFLVTELDINGIGALPGYFHRGVS